MCSEIAYTSVIGLLLLALGPHFAWVTQLIELGPFWFGLTNIR